MVIEDAIMREDVKKWNTGFINGLKVMEHLIISEDMDILVQQRLLQKINYYKSEINRQTNEANQASDRVSRKIRASGRG